MPSPEVGGLVFKSRVRGGRVLKCRVLKGEGEFKSRFLKFEIGVRKRGAELRFQESSPEKGGVDKSCVKKAGGEIGFRKRVLNSRTR